MKKDASAKIEKNSCSVSNVCTAFNWPNSGDINEILEVMCV